MIIDPKIEDVNRTMIGHVIRQEFEELQNEMLRIGNDTFLRAMAVCVYVAGYITVDVPEHWPTDADVREIAAHTAVSARGFELSRDDVFTFLTRVALGGERMAAVFPPEVGVMLPLQVASTLLLAFLPTDKKWWEYLDVIENALNAAEQVDLSLLPALMLRAQHGRAANLQ
jgi:hypothetical protein